MGMYRPRDRASYRATQNRDIRRFRYRRASYLTPFGESHERCEMVMRVAAVDAACQSATEMPLA